MANNRLLLLSTVTLVAVIVQIGASEHIPSAEDNLQLEKLGKNLLSPEEVKIILESIEAKDQIKIGTLSVRIILDIANEPGDLPPEMAGQECHYDAISEFVLELMEDNSKLFFNVFEFVHPKLMLCSLNIIEIYIDNRRLAKVRKEDVPKEEVGEILRSIEDKENFKIGSSNVQTILDQIDRAMRPYLSVEDCDDVVPRYLGDEDILVANLEKFDESRYRLVSFCAQSSRLVVDRFTSSFSDEDKRCFRELRSEIDNFSGSLFNNPRVREYAMARQIKERCLRLAAKREAAQYITEEIEKKGGPPPTPSFDALNGQEWMEMDRLCSLHRLNFYADYSETFN